MNIEQNQFIDEIISYEPGKAICCQSRLPDDAPVFQGHFPDNPMLPVVLMVDAIAQASGFLYFMDHDFGNMVYLVSIKSAKFYGFLSPGQAVKISATSTHTGSGYLLTKGLIETDRRIASAELFLKVMPFPTTAMQAALQKTVGEKIMQFRQGAATAPA